LPIVALSFVAVAIALPLIPFLRSSYGGRFVFIIVAALILKLLFSLFNFSSWHDPLIGLAGLLLALFIEALIGEKETALKSHLASILLLCASFVAAHPSSAEDLPTPVALICRSDCLAASVS
jgi:xanthosine utilization system XapX-like protein